MATEASKIAVEITAQSTTLQASVAKASASLKGLGDVIAKQSKASITAGDATIRSNKAVTLSYESMARAGAKTAEMQKLLTAQTKAAEVQTLRNVQALRKSEEAHKSHLNALQRTGASLDSAGKKMQNFGHLMAPVSLGLLGIGVYSIKASMQFQSAMELLRTQAGASQAEVNSMTKAVLNMAPAVDIGPNELAKGLFHVESAGYRGQEAFKALEQSAKGAAIGQANLEDVTNSLLAVLKTGIGGVHGAADAMGQLNNIIGEGNMRMQDLTAAIATGLPLTAKQVGISLKDMGAALDLMTIKGVPASKAATSLRFALMNMAAPSAKATEALEQIGIKQGQLGEDLRKRGLLFAVEDLVKHMHEMGVTGQKETELLKEAFGGVRSSAAILTLTQDVGGLQTKLKQLGSGEGAKAFEEKFKKTSETSQFKWHQMTATIESDSIKMGTTLLPVANKIVGDITKLVDWFNKLPKPVKDSVAAMAALGAVLAPIALAMGTISRLGGVVFKGAGGAGGVLGKAFGMGGGISGARSGGMGPGSPGNPIVTVMEDAQYAGLGGRAAPGGTASGAAAEKAGGLAKLGAAARFGARAGGAALLGIEAANIILPGAPTARGLPTHGAGVTGQFSSWTHDASEAISKGFGDLLSGKVGAAFGSIFGHNAVDDLRSFGDQLKKLKAPMDELPLSKLMDIEREAIKLGHNKDLEKWWPQLRGVAAEAARAKTETGQRFAEMRMAAEREVRALGGQLAKLSPAAVQPMMSAFSQMRAAIKGEMEAGVRDTASGTAQIHRILEGELKALGVKAPSKANQAFGPLPGGGANPLQPTGIGGPSGFTGLAMGGYIGRAGERGGDNVPIMVGRGEAVLNYAQQAVADRALAAGGYGGLDQLFSATAGTRHYMAAGGYAGGGKVGGSSAMARMLAEAGAISAQHFPYLWGGGHSAAFSGPYDCSGAVSAVLHAGGLLNAPRVAGEFENFGDPGKGAVTLYVNDNVHVYMSLGGRFFGTSLSNPGGGAGFFAGGPRPGFAERHVPGLLLGGEGAGTIGIPKWTGPGGMIGSLGRGTERKIADAANQKLMQALASVTGGKAGGGNAGDVATMGAALGGSWQNELRTISGQRGWSANDWFEIVAAESGTPGQLGTGDPTSSNSSGAFGLGQALGATKSQFPKMVSSDPATQIVGMAEYIAQRYGNPTRAWAFHLANNWYGAGGRTTRFPRGGSARGVHHQGLKAVKPPTQKPGTKLKKQVKPLSPKQLATLESLSGKIVPKWEDAQTTAQQLQGLQQLFQAQEGEDQYLNPDGSLNVAGIGKKTADDQELVRMQSRIYGDWTDLLPLVSGALTMELGKESNIEGRINKDKLTIAKDNKAIALNKEKIAGLRAVALAIKKPTPDAVKAIQVQIAQAKAHWDPLVKAAEGARSGYVPQRFTAETYKPGEKPTTIQRQLTAKHNSEGRTRVAGLNAEERGRLEAAVRAVKGEEEGVLGPLRVTLAKARAAQAAHKFHVALEGFHLSQQIQGLDRADLKLTNKDKALSETDAQLKEALGGQAGAGTALGVIENIAGQLGTVKWDKAGHFVGIDTTDQGAAFSAGIQLISLQNDLAGIARTAQAPPAAQENSQLVQLLQQQNTQLAEAYALSQAQFKVLTTFAPNIPHFASGGPVLNDGLIYAHRGEHVVPAQGQLVRDSGQRIPDVVNHFTVQGSMAPLIDIIDQRVRHPDNARHISTHIGRRTSMLAGAPGGFR